MIFYILSPSNSQVTKTDISNLVLKMPKNNVFGYFSALVSGLRAKISQKMQNPAAVQHVEYLSDI